MPSLKPRTFLHLLPWAVVCACATMIPRVGEANCGDYLARHTTGGWSISGERQQTVGDPATMPGHSSESDENRLSPAHPRNNGPCRGPSCRQAPELPVPTPAPPNISGGDRQPAVLAALADHRLWEQLRPPVRENDRARRGFHPRVDRPPRLG